MSPTDLVYSNGPVTLGQQLQIASHWPNLLLDSKIWLEPRQYSSYSSVAVLVLLWQNGVVVTKTGWPKSQRCLLSGALPKQLTDLCLIYVVPRK